MSACDTFLGVAEFALRGRLVPSTREDVLNVSWHEENRPLNLDATFSSDGLFSGFVLSALCQQPLQNVQISGSMAEAHELLVCAGPLNWCNSLHISIDGGEFKPIDASSRIPQVCGTLARKCRISREVRTVCRNWLNFPSFGRLSAWSA